MLRLSLAAVQRCFLRRLGQRGQDAVVSNAQLRQEGGEKSMKQYDGPKYGIGYLKEEVVSEQKVTMLGLLDCSIVVGCSGAEDDE